METTVFSILLFFVFYFFLVWLFDVESIGATESPASTDTSIPTVEKASLQAPIEQQCKKISNEILTSETEEKVTEQEIDRLKIREARKTIARLNEGLPRNHKDRIRLKVNGKDQPLKWLQTQIKLKLKGDRDLVTRIVSDIVTAA